MIILTKPDEFLCSMPKANVFQINDLLKAEGFTPWTRDCEEKKRYAKKSM